MCAVYRPFAGAVPAWSFRPGSSPVIHTLADGHGTAGGHRWAVTCVAVTSGELSNTSIAQAAFVSSGLSLAATWDTPLPPGSLAVAARALRARYCLGGERSPQPLGWTPFYNPLSQPRGSKEVLTTSGMASVSKGSYVFQVRHGLRHC